MTFITKMLMSRILSVEAGEARQEGPGKNPYVALSEKHKPKSKPTKQRGKQIRRASGRGR